MKSLCWWLYDGNWFQMLVTESLCWRFFSLCWWFSQCIRSPTSQTCHHYIRSPTSITNIDVTIIHVRNRMFSNSLTFQQHYHIKSISESTISSFWSLTDAVYFHSKHWIYAWLIRTKYYRKYYEPMKIKNLYFINEKINKIVLTDVSFE